MRLLLTGYSELDAVVASVNEGEIFRFINKPWDAQELKNTVQQAADISAQLFGAGTQVPPAPLQTETGSFVAPSNEGILVLDDDEEIARSIGDIVGASQAVHWARSVDEALSLLSVHDIGVVVSELVVGAESVTALLKLLKAQHPEVVTLVLTPFQDVTVFIGLINQGQVYRLLPKPLRRGPLSMSLASALRHHRMLKNSPGLIRTQAVETLRAPEELGVATRLMGVLGRIRGRGAPMVDRFS
jgi:serine/threonine-protein kinase